VIDFGIDEEMHAENRRRAIELDRRQGTHAVFYFDAWSLSGLLSDADMSVALDVYEEYGFRDFVRFIGALLPEKLRVGNTVTTKRYLRSSPPVDRIERGAGGIVKEVTPSRVTIQFYPTPYRLDAAGGILGVKEDDYREWPNRSWVVGPKIRPLSPAASALMGSPLQSLGDFPVDIEVRFAYGVDHFSYDLGLDPDEVLEVMEHYWAGWAEERRFEEDEKGFFNWFVSTYRLPTKRASGDYGAELVYIDVDLPNTITLVDDSLVDVGPLEETISSY
jgi:hypothetical protein